MSVLFTVQPVVPCISAMVAAILLVCPANQPISTFKTLSFHDADKGKCADPNIHETY
jgi:hypothetical protein